MNDLMGLIKNEFMSLNAVLRKDVDGLNKIGKKNIREKILTPLGEVYKIEVLSEAELADMRYIYGVDGSVNKLGGLHPHYIELYVAEAKPTERDIATVVRADIFSPLIDYSQSMELSREQRLAAIEIEAAIGVFENSNRLPFAIMMDGGLLRYKIEAGDRWEELRRLALENNVYLFGVIKDPKTSMISEVSELERAYYDREVLFGTLERGEIFVIGDEFNGKSRDGISSAFMRLSKNPSAIGMDVLKEQADEMMKLAGLCMALTASSSRGVPMWLDIVDAEVKLSDVKLNAFASEFLDKDVYERFLSTERERRVNY